MSWNYRVIKHSDDLNRENTWYGIHEVYYDELHNIEVWSIDPINPIGKSHKELKDDLMNMIKALEVPIFEEIIINGKTILKIVEDE